MADEHAIEARIEFLEAALRREQQRVSQLQLSAAHWKEAAQRAYAFQLGSRFATHSNTGANSDHRQNSRPGTARADGESR